jgi:hypothetical protein
LLEFAWSELFVTHTYYVRLFVTFETLEIELFE